MIWNPKPGQKVKIHYARKKRQCCEGIPGVVKFTAMGPGPRNVCVECNDGQGLTWLECIPRGNLIKREFPK